MMSLELTFFLAGYLGLIATFSLGRVASPGGGVVRRPLSPYLRSRCVDGPSPAGILCPFYSGRR